VIEEDGCRIFLRNAGNHLQVYTSKPPEDGGNMFLRNVGNNIPGYSPINEIQKFINVE
jgi:hypothetical protein